MDVNGYFVPAGSSSSALAYYPVSACRVLDTRAANGPFGGPSFAATETRDLTISGGACGIPAGASAYALNFTVIPRGGLSFLASWPSGSTRPGVSTLNAFTGAITANAAVVPAGPNGAVSIYATDAADVLVDVNGYFAPPAAGGLSFHTATPCRVVDTRWLGVETFGAPGLDGVANRRFPVNVGVCGVPTAAAYSLNATVVPKPQLDFLSLWDGSGERPAVSTLNSFDGSVVSNAAIVKSTNGIISAFGSQVGELILDLNGYFTQ